jgi:hypothetical protein
VELAGHGDRVGGGADGLGSEAVLSRLLALALGREAVSGDAASQGGWIHLDHGGIKDSTGNRRDSVSPLPGGSDAGAILRLIEVHS